ncbi:MAG: hypothetical protein QME64_09500, partial [bacterium]|nr:hypothetical protein [bacterium]
VDSFEYPRQSIEISNQKIDQIIAQELTQHGLTEHLPPPDTSVPLVSAMQTPLRNRDDLIQSILDWIKLITDELLSEAGMGSQHKMVLYEVLMDHIGKKILQNKTIGLCEERELYFLLRHIEQVKKNFSRPGLISSIMRYPNAK